MIDLKQLTVKELKELEKTICTEIDKRKKEEYKKDFKNCLAVLQVMAEKYPYEGGFIFETDYYDLNWKEIYETIRPYVIIDLPKERQIIE